ncbi:NAD-glutamate dehydrogenase domain-containing protein [Mycolicibacterium confluentis]|uniref:NAD-glutamate dehydrogenase n=1 Tax=Mycolicibacterium confluentis TaxID=28047 RepID=A0A7I7Y7G8_9MYCO|nr:NAD-glutamate dehydrogenase domain-containing protein [Mycolicibacterium confluentis]MCV7319207.1 NAD-glutamate dehydrogenase [Mycolicibacterium confluentis]ORV24917.1 NAD-glutamate dehydrogenase [Mycolicibacterium confluentis]BBZ36821.1 NAD-glutamate dehydrogenase [Mycolicibacterium confluentis]
MASPVSFFNVEELNTLSADEINVRVNRVDRLSFALAAAHPVPLRRMLPGLESMDLEVINEYTTTWTRSDGTVCHIYELVLDPNTEGAQGFAANWPKAEQQICDTFRAIWTGRIEADRFNALIPAAGLDWRQVAVLRSYSRYLRQLPLPYGQSRIQQVLLDNPAAAAAAVALFEARFDRQADPTAADDQLGTAIDGLVHIDADRVMRAYRNLINATLRTNAFAPEALGPSAPYLVHKLDAQQIDELPQPRPLSEIFVYSPEFEGVHLRFGLVARGGLRWSDRHDDYRTEVLGLVKAQAVKNAMIVPAGAKGVFVVKSTAPSREDGMRCYQQFVSALLDVVDNAADSDSSAAAPVRHDGADPYLVVAADKGTATFSDVANAVAVGRGYWLGDAFASGGSAGYDHKAMGITARGAWISGDSHLRELGIDSDTDEFRVVGVGDMSGDVFGNGMLLRRGIRLIAAFDHRHIFIDPDPATRDAYGERERLFALARSSWDDYDRAVISAGGGVWPRTAKTIPVSPQMRHALGIDDAAQHVTPTDLIRHILCAPVDLLFNGGIGTYIKASDEQHADVTDKVNDGVRVDASQVRARVIVEGGNLGVSQRGRIEFARRGGHINTDAIDNAAGVDCSDHEVNIKILLAGRHPAADRDALLVEMTDEVAAHVLANNLAHNRLLRDARANAAQMVTTHARMTTALERDRDLHRERENLPSADEFAELAKSGGSLCGPQLATLMAHTKLALKADLLASDDFDDDPHFTAALHRYFPATLRQRMGDQLSEHPLRREIIATSVVNHLLATSGLTYAFRLAEETGATTGEIVRAHAIVSGVFELDALWDDIRAAGLAPALTDDLVIEARRLLDRASRWFLVNRPQPLSIDLECGRFQAVPTLRGKLIEMLRGGELATVNRWREEWEAQGVPTDIARRISDSLYAYSLLDIIEMAHEHDEDATRLAHIYFELSEHLGVDNLLLAVSSLPRSGRWNALARLALREDLYRSLRDLARDVHRLVGAHTDGVDVIEEFESYNRSRIERARRTLQEFQNTENPDLSVLSVATAQLRRLTTGV